VIILFVFLAAIAFALARGGRLANLANIRLRFFYLLFAPLVLQLLAFSPFGANLPRGVPYIYLCSLLVGGIVVWFNRSLPGFPLLFAGLLCNLLVITLNGGFMPVSMAARAVAGQTPFSGVYNNVTAMTSGTLLWFLADLIPLPGWLPLSNVFSLGDVLITLGGTIFILRTLLTAERQPATSSIIQEQSAAEA